MPTDQIRSTKNAFSWGSIKLKVAGDPYYGFTSISFGDKIERAFGYGLGAHHGPRTQSKGKYSTEPVKLKGYPESVQILRATLAELSETGNSYGGVEFSATAMRVERDKEPILVELLGCLWAENASSDEENPDPTMEEITFTCMKVKRNGLVLWDDSDGDPS
jgi:hypothetical protein